MLSEFLNKQYQLTNGQQEIVGLLDEFLINNEANCFLLKGYAGTGKTFLMKGLTDYLHSINRNFRISAPPGRSAKIISQKTKRKAYTIHKSIYSNTDIKEYEIVENEEGGETFKYFYDLRNNEDAFNTIYIVDESSMISDDYSEGDFFRFGTGHLLSDFINFVNCLKHDDRKIIFIGDDAQLPPYSSKSSPALSAKYILDIFQLNVREYELTEVVRQSGNSGILKNATELRNSIKNNYHAKIKIDMQYNDTIETKSQELEEKYFLVCTSPENDNTIFIAYSNKLVKEYNDFVRRKFFPNQNYIVKGDKVIVVANNYNQPIEVLNGDFGIIKEVSNSPCSRDITLKAKDKSGKVIEINICLTFREVKISLKDLDDQEHILSCNIVENLLYSDERDLSKDETRALYVDFRMRHRDLKPRTPEFKIALREDGYFNALRIKFGYAVTCHKAQGGEWENTFVNFETSQDKSNSNYFRWAYTALTRAKQTIFCINAPNRSIFSNLQPIDNMTNEISFPSEKPFLKEFYEEQKQILDKHNILIESVKHCDYHEIYSYEQNGFYAVIKFHYNKKFIFRRYEPIEARVTSQELKTQIIDLLLRSHLEISQ